MRSKLRAQTHNLERQVENLSEITLDKFRDECGVFGIYGHPDAGRLTYLGLYALQHRGQESCGIVSSDGTELRLERAMGHVAEAFDQERLDRLPGATRSGMCVTRPQAQFQSAKPNRFWLPASTARSPSVTMGICRLRAKNGASSNERERSSRPRPIQK